MGTIRVAIDGEPLFTWSGDETAVAETLEAFPKIAHRVGKTAEEFSHDCLANLGLLPELEKEASQEVQMMAVIWRILKADTHHPEHPGKIADYVGAVNFDVDLQLSERGFKAEVLAFPRFHS